MHIKRTLPSECFSPKLRNVLGSIEKAVESWPFKVVATFFAKTGTSIDPDLKEEKSTLAEQEREVRTACSA